MKHLNEYCRDIKYFKEELDFNLDALFELKNENSEIDDVCFVLEHCLESAQTVKEMEYSDVQLVK